MNVAADLMREDGASAVTMGAIAERAGLSRTAVYEYYRSAGDLIADVIVDELSAWADHLDDCCAGIDDPRLRLETWIRSALAYVADGRHALARAAGDATLSPVRRAQVASMHRDLARPIVEAVADLGVPSADRYAGYVWGIVDSATRRIDAAQRPIESSADSAHLSRSQVIRDEVDAAVTFALAGIDLAH